MHLARDSPNLLMHFPLISLTYDCLENKPECKTFKYASAYLFLEQAYSFCCEIYGITSNLELEIMKQIIPIYIYIYI